MIVAGDLVGMDFIAVFLDQGNAMGLTILCRRNGRYGGTRFVGKWLELLQESVPRVTTVAVLGQIGNFLNVKVLEALEAAASGRGLSIRFFGLKVEGAIAAAVEEARHHAQALLVLSDPITFQARQRLVMLATKAQLPTVFPWREFVHVGARSRATS